jgi:tRNA A-37 threonylcarbamoyl transferase component Bud32
LTHESTSTEHEFIEITEDGRVDAFEIMHGVAPHIHYGNDTETHILGTAVVKRSANSLIKEAALHSIAYATNPSGVARPVAYVTANECASSALVTEYAGEDGFRFLKKKPSVRDTVAWFTQVVDAVVHMHADRIVHGDLKLNNTCHIGGKWRVIDFGLSMQHAHGLVTRDFIYAGDGSDECRHLPFNTSFDLRVFIWSCIIHTAHEGPWDAWRSRFACNYAHAWALRDAAQGLHGRQRSKALNRALHAMYTPVFAFHDAEFDPLRVLNTVHLAYGPEGHGPAQGVGLRDTPAREPA